MPGLKNHVSSTKDTQLLFDVESVKTGDRLPFIEEEGNYLVEVVAMEQFKSQRGKGNMFKFVGRLVESNSEKNPADTEFVWFPKNKDENAMLGSIKRLVGAVMSKSATEVTNEDLQNCLDGACTGNKVRLSTRLWVNRGEVTNFMIHNFYPV